ncbi:cupin domain-containing protein [Candidatus Neomarinimicrobiota bacterium]
MTKKEPLKTTADSTTPTSGEWFTLHVSESNWLQDSRFGTVCDFEGSNHFTDLGINLRVLNPGQPASLYHQEGGQENFLVLSGACRLIIDGEERPLQAGHFVHCPPRIPHVFVGAGSAPCVILMVGHRPQVAEILYPVNELAAKYGASVDEVTDQPKIAYGQSPIFDQTVEPVWPLW